MVQFSLEAVVLSVPDNIRTGSEAHTALYSEDTGSSYLVGSSGTGVNVTLMAGTGTASEW